LRDKVWREFDLAEILRNAPADDSSRLDLIRRIVHKMNSSSRKTEEARPLYAGQLHGMGLLSDVLRYLIDRYCREEHPGSMDKGLKWASRKLGEAAIETPVSRFVKYFPPLDVELGVGNSEDYLDASSPDSPRRYLVPRELVLLVLSTTNPALRSLQPLFDDSDLKRDTSYPSLVEELEDFFNRQPVIDRLGESLFAALRAPILASPDSLDGQIDYILRNWKDFLPEDLLRRLLRARDLLREEEKLRVHGAGSPQVLRFEARGLLEGEGLTETERFSPDQNWMENVVLLAKSTYVWLDQLSRIYGRSIRTLDQIPDEELDRLAGWGITGLWLIGVWERSPASREIKRWCGNPEALSSAYSLYDYQVAEDLGGPEALENLRDRAWRRGIRLASDMVPNHVGLYSKWVVEHPDWFIQLDHPPFPNYRFSGPDLSDDERVGLFIEDGYWDHRDAAVVFKRVDRWTGETRYIYHGNDGTHMPWNDTAQLDYMKSGSAKPSLTPSSMSPALFRSSASMPP